METQLLDAPDRDTFETVHLAHADDGSVAVITLDRQRRLNAMTAQLVEELHQTLSAVAQDDAVRVVVLTGAGRGFCAGLDLTGYGTLPGSEGVGRVPVGMRVQQHIATLATQLRTLPKPVIAAVNGPAAGGGLALALASDVRIAATSATFNVAFVRIGLSGCDIGVSWMLPRLIGASRAFELLLTGRIVDAAEADRLGLVSRVVDDGTVLDAALDTARLIARNSPMGVWMTKEVMWSQLEIPSMQAGIDLENRTQILCSQTADHPEAMKAFLEKRPPSFRFA
jgi:enoyl-CoA hydratase